MEGWMLLSQKLHQHAQVQILQGPAKSQRLTTWLQTFPRQPFFLTLFFCKMKFQSQKLAMAKKLTAFQGNTPRQVGKLARCFSRVTQKLPTEKTRATLAI